MSGPVDGPIRVVIVDDHAVVRSGLRLLLDREEGIDVVAEAGTADEGVRAARRVSAGTS